MSVISWLEKTIGVVGYMLCKDLRINFFIIIWPTHFSHRIA